MASRRAKQLTFVPITKDAANASALPKAGAGQVRQRIKLKISDFKIADSRKDFTLGIDYGFKRGQYVYFNCPFHKERTPSCRWSPKGAVAVEYWTWGDQESLAKLAVELMLWSVTAGIDRAVSNRLMALAMDVHRRAVRRWWHEQYSGGAVTRTSHFHCFGCGASGGWAKLVRGLMARP